MKCLGTWSKMSQNMIWNVHGTKCPDSMLKLTLISLSRSLVLLTISSFDIRNTSSPSDSCKKKIYKWFGKVLIKRMHEIYSSSYFSSFWIRPCTDEFLKYFVVNFHRNEKLKHIYLCNWWDLWDCVISTIFKCEVWWEFQFRGN